MRRIVKVVEQDEYDAWLAEQQSYYMQNVRNTEDDPYAGQLLGVDISNRNAELTAEFENADANGQIGDIISLKNVFFETGSAVLTADSQYELKKVGELLNKYSNMNIEVGGHTDSTGNPDSNQTLSEARANSVMSYLTGTGRVGNNRLTSQGYGPNNPVGDNATEEGRQQNRRTELKIISK